MTVICAWCGKIIKEGEGGETHGICPSCLEIFMHNITRPTTPLEVLEKYIPHLHSGHTAEQEKCLDRIPV